MTQTNAAIITDIHNQLKQMHAGPYTDGVLPLSLLEKYGEHIIPQYGREIFDDFYADATAAGDHATASRFKSLAVWYEFKKLCFSIEELTAAQVQRADEILTQYPSFLKANMNCFTLNSSALCAAAGYGQPELCRLLIKHGVDVNHKYDRDGSTALHFITGWEQHTRIPESRFARAARVLLENGADVEHKNRRDKTPLLCMINKNKYLLCCEFLRYGASLEAAGIPRDQTPPWLEAYQQETRDYFSGGSASKASCFTGEALADSVLDACATGQFTRLIGAPLLSSGRKEDVALFGEIWSKLPQHWRQEYDALHMDYVKASQQHGLGTYAHAAKHASASGVAHG